MQKLKIQLDNISKDVVIELFAIIPDTLFEVSDARENNEARFQIVEGCYYQYKLTNGYYFHGNEVIEVSNFNSSEGRISPNFYVGTLTIPILKKGIEKGVFQLEVQSIKTSYRQDYRFMLESITKHATDLILQTNSPVSQSLEADYDSDPKTLYQQFCFVKSIIDTDDFEVAINQIAKAPVTAWTTKREERDIRKLNRLSSKDIRSLVHSQNRVKLPLNHFLRKKDIESVSIRIPTSIKEETTDTLENQFIKYALETFYFFCEEIQIKSKKDSRLNKEAQLIANKLNSFLQYNLFKEVSSFTSIKLNSPVLQRKSGYREVLKNWLMFDLAGKLTWDGGEDVYSAGSKNISKLYEYWLFFKILDAIKQTFDIDSDQYKKLISSTNDKLGLKLKEGKQVALTGTYSSRERELLVEFSYNKTFSTSKELSQEGSWTLQMDPDFTLSIWPKELPKEIAERKEQIVHIHFDAKYKVKNKKENLYFKREDVIKMHAYKDAIKRTGGAYILYPGLEKDPTTYRGFHEVLPGLGAFAIRPSEYHSGIENLIDFIVQIKNHFLNRATQRENISTKIYQITKDGTSKGFSEPIPEFIRGKKLIPSETFVLIGYIKSEKHLDWILRNNLYNFRTDTNRGALKLNRQAFNAKFLLLHSKDEQSTSKLFTITGTGFRITKKTTLKRLKYPNPSQDNYLVIKIEPCLKKEFANKSWNFKELKGYKSRRASAIPFAVSLESFLGCKQ